MDWLATDSMYLDWLTLDRPVPPGYAAHQADKMVQMGFKVHLYLVQVGGPVIYDSLLAPRSPSLDRDLLRDLVEEDAKRNIRLVAGWLGTLPANALQVHEHPDWIVRLPDGAPAQGVCYNSPIRELVFAQVREVLAGYDVHGIYFDQLFTGCYCFYCRRHFEEIYGEPLLAGPEITVDPSAHRLYLGHPDERRLLRFAESKKAAFLRNVRQIIDRSGRPAALITNGLVGPRARLGIGIVHALLPEVVATARSQVDSGGRDTLGAMADRALTVAYGKVPTYGEVKYDNYAPRSVPLAHGIVQSAAAVANGNPIVLRDQDAIDTDTPHKRQRLFRALSQLSQAYQELAGAAPLRYVALLHSLSSHLANPVSTEQSFHGFHRLLAESQIPFTVMTEDAVLQGALQGHSCLVLPNAESIAPAVVEQIHRFVAAGGGLLATYRSGLHSPDGGYTTAQDPLAGLLGVLRYDTVSNRRQTAPKLKEIPNPSQHASDFFYGRAAGDDSDPVPASIRGARLDFQAPVMEVQPLPGTRVLAHVLDFDQSLMNTPYDRRMPFPGHPRNPLATLNGKVAYVAAPLERSEARENCDELNDLLLAVLHHLGGPLPFKVVGAPPSVFISASRSAAGALCFWLVNLSSAPTPAGIFSYVVPVHGLQIAIPGYQGRAAHVSSLRGSAATLQPQNGSLVVTLERLDEFDLLQVHSGA